jgi:hypothetical protein
VLLNFQVAFVVVGIVVTAASMLCLQLPRDAGAEVSGHRVDRRYDEIDPDVFGEELEQPAYAAAHRIAVVGLVVTRR